MTAETAPVRLADNPSPAQRPQRRLSDKLLALFHQACDQEEFEVAKHLLQVCDLMVARPGNAGRDRRRNLDALVAAHERLWHLQHRDTV